ncbi:IS5 family transposase [Streptomyces sp. NPDC048277]|uniref:IS5 family transposase n=1 Tax=Streptomyces sp. NPDC048277 TaxID=3155027 RepID=UPI0033FCA6EE
MTDAEWAAIRPLLPVPAWLQGRGGQPGGYCHRQMPDAIRYLVAGGISWRAMPVDFPAWARVYAFFRRWREHGLITEFHDRLRGRVRERQGREAEPTAGIIDAQSVRAAATVPAASRGYDGGKKVPGRKRHIVTDTLGLLLVVAVTAANIADRDAAAGLLERLRRLHRDITLIWADGGCTGDLVDWCRQKLALCGGAGVWHGPPADAEHSRRLLHEPPALRQTPGLRARPLDLCRHRLQTQLHRDLPGLQRSPAR